MTSSYRVHDSSEHSHQLPSAQLQQPFFSYQLGVGGLVMQVKVVVLGGAAVGKTAIIRQFVYQQFSERHEPTLDRHLYYPSIINNERIFDLRLADLPQVCGFPSDSMDEWTRFRGFGLRSASAYVLVFDITSVESFQFVKAMRAQIIRHQGWRPILIVGNKHDLLEACFRPDCKDLAQFIRKQWKCQYVECSAKYNWHITRVFEELVKLLDQNQHPGGATHPPAHHRNGGHAVAQHHHHHHSHSSGGGGSSSPPRRPCAVQ